MEIVRGYLSDRCALSPNPADITVFALLWVPITSFYNGIFTLIDVHT